MSVTPLSPGVYVREAPGGPRAIEGAPTAVTIFVGETERGPISPTSVTSRLDFERLYGGYFRHTVDAPDDLTGGASDFSKLFMPYAIDGFFSNGGPRAYVLRVLDSPPVGTVTASRNLTDGGAGSADIVANSPGAWGNFIFVAVRDSSDGDSNRFRLEVSYQRPGESSAELVEEWDGLSTEPADEKYVVDTLRRSNYLRWEDNVDAIRPTTDVGDAVALTGGIGGSGDVLATAYGELLSALRGIMDAALLVNASDQLLRANDASYMDISNEFIDYVTNERSQLDLFFVGDLPRFRNETDRIASVVNAVRGGDSTAGNFCGMYWPHIRVSDPVGQGANPEIVIPPAGHIAGLYGRTDGRRGVWKAPAGVELRVGGARGFDFDVLEVDQDRLNPLGVNALRLIPGAGLVVWGSRTREPASQWRYIPVRRTAMFLRKSIYNGIQWAVFEPNDEPLWASLRATIGAFMETQFRNGAFAGATSREAYFVKCDAETTTEADQIAGVVNILVGFAPLRPAEFVIVTLSQKTGQQA